MKENKGGGQAPRMPAYGAEYLLFGALLAYGNRLQVLGDGFYTEVTTKQWFLLACLELFEAPPTLGEVAGAMGCSHQNAKQLALKLAQKGYVLLRRDAAALAGGGGRAPHPGAAGPGRRRAAGELPPKTAGVYAGSVCGRAPEGHKSGAGCNSEAG